MTSPALVSVVILNWNGGRALADAAASVLDQTHEELELIVVDNGSTDGSLDSLPSDRRLRVISNGENLGFARGMNVGWEASRGTYWIPMNDDVVLHPRFVDEAVRVLETTPLAGAVAPLVLRSIDSRRPWDETGPAALVSGPEAVTIDMRVVADQPVDRSTLTFKANGSCPVYRVDALAQVLDLIDCGPFDPWFDTYGEDVDLSFRLHSLGWSTVFSPTVLAAHHVARSSANRIHDKRGRVRRNVLAARHANAWRHLPVVRLLVAVPMIAIGDLVFAVLSLVRRDPTATRDVGAAWVRVAGSLPSFLRERRRFPPRPHAEAGQFRWASRREVSADLPSIARMQPGADPDRPEQAAS